MRITDYLPPVIPDSSILEPRVQSIAEDTNDKSNTPPYINFLNNLNLLTPEENARLQDLDIDLQVDYLIKKLIDENAQFVTSQRNIFDRENAFLKAKESERISETEKGIFQVNNTNTLNKIQSGLSAFGLMASGLHGIVTDSKELGAIAFLVGGLLALDNFIDHAVKFEIAKWFAKATQENEKDWLERIQLALTVISMGVSFKLTGSESINLAMNISKAGLSFIRAGVDHQLNFQKAILMELDNTIENSQRRSELLIKHVHEISQRLLEYYATIHDIRKNRQRILTNLIHFKN